MKIVLLMPKQQLGVVFEMRQFVSKHLRKPHHHHQKQTTQETKSQTWNNCNFSADKRTMLLSQSDGGVEMMVVTMGLKPDLLSRWGTTVSCHCSIREKYSTFRPRGAQSRC